MVNVFHNSLSKYRHNDPYSLNDQAVSINYKCDKLKIIVAHFWDIFSWKGYPIPFLCYVVFFVCGYFNLRPSALFIAWSCLCPGLLAGDALLTIQCWPANTIVNDFYSTLYLFLYLYLCLYLCWTLSLPAPSLLLLAIQCWPANGTVINLAQPEQQEKGGRKLSERLICF